MAKNIYGGGSTTNEHGLRFEQETKLIDALKDNGLKINSLNQVFQNENYVGLIISKGDLYKNFLKPRGVDYKKYISKKLIPDDAFFNELNKTVYIIEKKFQSCAGSVDEKLQTCDFKRKQYLKLFNNEHIQFNVEYIYVLNDWFKQDSYKDVLDYIQSMNCHYYFNTIPINILNL